MPKTLLIVDDNDDLRSALAYQLHARGYQVLMASDGRQSIQKAREDKPDLILMDVMMPGMDGTEAASKIKEDPETKRIPILFLTAIVQGDSAVHPETTKDLFTLPKSIDFEKLIFEIELALARK